MSISRKTWVVSGLIVILAVTMACSFPTATPTPTPTAGVLIGGSNGGTGGSNIGGNNGSQGGGNNGGTGSNKGGSTGNTGGSATEEPTQLIDINGGPYTVKQIETLGGEAISGTVCSLTQPFSVLSVTPHVTFTFIFVPKNESSGNVSYAYTISSAGESHDASGTYTVSQVDKGGTKQVALAVSDHVVFKGFDGKIPNRYKFNLVPSGGTPC